MNELESNINKIDTMNDFISDSKKIFSNFNLVEYDQYIEILEASNEMRIKFLDMLKMANDITTSTIFEGLEALNSLEVRIMLRIMSVIVKVMEVEDERETV